MNKKALLDFSLEQLTEEMDFLGEPAFRAGQLSRWLTACVPFSGMSNLPKDFRAKLEKTYVEGYLSVETVLTSRDGTRKYLLKLWDDNVVETVLMEYGYGRTLCISTQVGCPMACTFCASGKGGLVRNMSAGELLGQVLRVNAELGEGRNITNIVLMGTGEPLLNYNNVVTFLRRINGKESLNIAMRNISLSTCGIVPGIDALAEEGLPITLCLSLHSAIPSKRHALMPVEEKYPLPLVVEAMKRYNKKTGRRIIYEYILIEGFNMGEEDAYALSNMVANQNYHVNLIPLNAAGGPLKAPDKKHIYGFAEILSKKGVSATVRRTLGQDIEGACGQLRARFAKTPAE